MSISLVSYQSSHRSQLNAFDLPAEQLQFSALPKDKLQTDPGQYPIVIIDELHTAVGFFLLHATKRVQNYSLNSEAMLLTALTVDSKYQGNGYAKEAMLSIASFIQTHFPTVNEIVLAVNHRNIAAQQLYRKAGFADTGKRKLGKIGEQLILSKKIT